MPTPLTPDEEFDARFRRGLADGPAPPPADELAAWQRVSAQLDQADRLATLRRRVLRAFGLEVLLVAAVLWLGLRGLPAGPARVAGAGRQPAPAATAAKQANNLAATAPGGRPATVSGAEAQAVAAPASTAALETVEAERQPNHVAPARPNNPQAAAGGDASRRAPRAWLGVVARPTPRTRPLASENPEQKSGDAAWLREPAAEALANQRRRARLSARRDEATGRKHNPVGAGTLLAATSPQRTRLQRHRWATRAAPEPAVRNAAAAPGLTSSAEGGASAFRPAPVDPLAALGLGGGWYGRRPDSLAGVTLTPTAWPKDTLPTPARPLAAAYRLRLGLVAAPELSGVRAERLSPPGGNVGVQLEYQLARRWRLSTGYLLALKRYAARGSDYHPPAGYWPGTWTVERVDADCQIIDIPLNLRYDLWQRPRHQVFASVGLSSLLMRREDYTYTYTYGTAGQTRTADWELLNGSQHVLQILNLSAGYERAVGQRWSVQAEPFVKLPLGGVGFGAVRLSSAGVFFSLKYGLLPRAVAPPTAP